MGRAISWIWIMGLLAAAASVGATVFKVGDSAGWTTLVPVDYAKWASSKNFHVGDSLLFSYNNKFHNVLQVNQAQFKSCNSSSPVASYNSGADSIPLRRPGTFYFLCGFPGHCQLGQKVEIKVNPGSSSAAPSPSPSPLPNGPSTLGSPLASAPTPSAAASSTLSDLSLLCLPLALAAFYSFSLCV